MRSYWREDRPRSAAGNRLEAANHPFVDPCAFLLDSVVHGEGASGREQALTGIEELPHRCGSGDPPPRVPAQPRAESLGTTFKPHGRAVGEHFGDSLHDFGGVHSACRSRGLRRAPRRVAARRFFEAILRVFSQRFVRMVIISPDDGLQCCAQIR